ncbi:unnamed protein product, partial [Choristocarpus tenellus]
RIVLVGLDGAGKTTLLYQLCANQAIATIPTVGFNVEEIQLPGCTLVVWDLGGQANLRGLWVHYVKGVSGVIFMLDSSDLVRLREAETELATLLASADLEKEAAVLLLANKKD